MEVKEKTDTNALMATEVMKRKLFHHDNPDLNYWHDHGTEFTIMERDWAPTINMDQARECVEKFVGIKWHFEMEYFAKMWTVSLESKGEYHCELVKTSVSNAICKVILKAKGIKV